MILTTYVLIIVIGTTSQKIEYARKLDCEAIARTINTKQNTNTTAFCVKRN